MNSLASIPAHVRSAAILTLSNHLTRMLSQILQFSQPTESLLRQYFAEYPKLGQRDRARLSETVYFIIRRKSRIAHCQENPEAAASFLTEENPSQSAPPLEEFPTWLVESLNRQHPSAQETLMELQGLNAAAPLDLRVSRTQRDAILRRLQEEGHRAIATPHSPLGIRLVDKPSLRQHPLFSAREIEIQDEGSQLMTLFLGARRGEKVVDFCAGAGGKTLALMSLMRAGQVYATDIDGKRLQRLRDRTQGIKQGGVLLSLVQLRGDADEHLARWAGKMDRVLVDAPCSGLGTMRRQPDLLWRRKPEEIAVFADRQRHILRAAAPLVHPDGGVLLYGTCSILHEENQSVIADFLAQHRNFQRAVPQDADPILRPLLNEMGDLELRPHRHGTDGFYAARLKKSL